MENNDLVVENKPEVVGCDCAAEECKHSEPNKNMEEVIDPKTQKFVYVSDLCSDLKGNLKESVYSLLLLKEEVDFRKKLILDKVKFIKDKVDELSGKYKFSVDKQEQENAEKSVNQYTSLLDGISKEIEKELVHSYMLLNEGEKKLEKLISPLDGPASFEAYVVARIKWTKKFIKDLNKNLSVSFSRYMFGFEDQERRLVILESNLKHNAANK